MAVVKDLVSDPPSADILRLSLLSMSLLVMNHLKAANMQATSEPVIINSFDGR